MAKFSGLLASKKMNNRHSTMTADVKVLVSLAQKEPDITKIILGVVKSVSGGKPHLKFNPIQAGFVVKVRGLGDVQELFIYTKNVMMPAILEQKFMAAKS